ncbi:helix-turn-helix domain-containing protein [Tellurirhabdus bombi]|uniref:helix-turn-helix domain-containing protein n=1 Tax=Tellurirhabdus bombi TaxID=2907205 RepID=UPI001F412B98|nr:helix-turn-helix domain-containing protein [Tellurirhabdus bombi]
MRNIQNLAAEEVEQLRKAIRETANAAFKKRCQCVLYSYHGLSVSELMEVFEVDRRSIYNWLNRWEKGRMMGLEDKPGRGLKPKLNPENAYHVEQVMKAMNYYPRQPQQAVNHINKYLSIPVSQDTLRRFVKKISTLSTVNA